MARDVGGVSAKSPLQAGKPLLTVKPSHLGTLEWAMPGLQEKFTCFQEGTGSTVMEPESKLEIPANTASGASALQANTTGRDNTASGVSALQFNTTGKFNTAIGASALVRNTTGESNTAVGVEALRSNADGSFNTAVGKDALLANGTGLFNTATGANALTNNTTGIANTATGSGALGNNVTGTSNTAVGSSALLNNTGSDNIALGFAAGISQTTGSNNIYVDNFGLAGESNIIKIGNSGHTGGAFIAGVQVVAPSSRRFKEDIHDMDSASSALMRLRPATFRYKKVYANGDRTMQYGLIAEEVAEVYPELVVHNDEGQVQTVQYHKLNSMLLNEVQKQHRLNKRQADEIQRQREQIADLAERLAQLEQVLTRQRSLAEVTK